MKKKEMIHIGLLSGFFLGVMSIYANAAFASIPNETQHPAEGPRMTNPIESRIMRYSTYQKLLVEIKQVRQNYQRFATQNDAIGMGTQKRLAQIIHLRARQLGLSLVSTPTMNPVFHSWGWPEVPCTPGVTSILGLSSHPICVKPGSKLKAGQYQYNASSNQLVYIPTTAKQASTNQVLKSWGWLEVECSAGQVFISGITNSPVCVRPSPNLRSGQYRYDPVSHQLSLIK